MESDENEKVLCRKLRRSSAGGSLLSCTQQSDSGLKVSEDPSVVSRYMQNDQPVVCVPHQEPCQRPQAD